MKSIFLFILLFLLNNNLFSMQATAEKNHIYPNIEQAESSDVESQPQLSNEQARILNTLTELRQKLNDLTIEHESASQQISSIDEKISQQVQSSKKMVSERISASSSAIAMGVPLAITGGYYFFALCGKNICTHKVLAGLVALGGITALFLTGKRILNAHKYSDHTLSEKKQELIEIQKELDKKIKAMNILLNEIYSPRVIQ